jgi:integrase
MKKPEGQGTRFRFSAEKLAALSAPKDSPAIYYDTDIPQLCFRIQPTGNAVYFVLKKVLGKTYRRTLGDYPELKLDAARKHAHKLLSDVANYLAGDRKGPNPMTRPFDGDKLTFQTAFEMYLAAPGARVTNKERADARRQYLFDHCLKGISAKSIDDLTPTVIGAFHQKLTKEFGPVMANRAHEVLRAVYNHLIFKGLWTSVNPSKGATRAPKRERARILEPHELKPFKDALEAEKNRDFAEFIALDLATGVRVSNLYAAEWSEISYSRKTWTIPGEKMKNGKTATFTLKPEAITIFKLRQQGRKKDNPWVFPSKSGSKSGHIEDYKNQFTRLKKDAGLTDFTMHDLRRTFIAYNLMSGAPMPVVSEAAGHSNLDSMKPYARFAKGAVSRALEMGTAEMQRRMDEAEAEKEQEKEQEQKLLSA